MTETAITTPLLDAIGDAFNSNAIDAVMAHFADDAKFDHGAGSEVHGARFSGHDEIRAVFQKLFDSVESVQWETLDARIVGDKAYCEFRRRATLKTGEKQDFLALDVLTFRGDKIVHKDTYFKNRSV
tara:strand:+ start:57 stop:437 length:381 start_codon:yes stop_codon:yes gene_type:complete